MDSALQQQLIAGIRDGSIVPYLGAGALRGSVAVSGGEPIPADSDSLIHAINNGSPMAPKLMYEFPRAAMNLELKKGRSYITRTLNKIYSETEWTRAPLHDLLAGIKPHYIVDINRDTQLQDSYADTPHTLIVGLSRLGATQYRFRIFSYTDGTYSETTQEAVDPALPILFKPMGTPRPEPIFVASDADYVDYITELMGGFAIPSFLKEYRIGKQYLFLGLRMQRDTERMVLSDIMYGAGSPSAWALIAEPNAKERRFCKKMGIEIIESDIDSLIAGATSIIEEAAEETMLVGC
ncbi:MAG: SIR2 family protein [Zetaproteobacteria bacterium CG06_land_8_20_14_3_00_59_53]|nr:MAG: SIR2 family protein [Zetaproteobacteria bacterium CG2_30_59_37]PIO90496.1 MAG: SIR2 family protein [Zetaproteobacteria bacterium CG23_combo_of_CG06-09_8_20_14_all_59_86]PIQ65967.1 MAG: SIR2 family protein [Zetaproteobacteria bacterium CG11_big_fil_rev_8_21_14_0_20_59_439]PIU71447.1 MAG: SIR2 family protein [Zetaproteobacteria bacterium CG06_land_8_20_14_3_00_59_53]PIU97703.1 MAG: SIR2 family protein [Zetaproteobacteria bacterium CG03_land_8_20_14_0_80_59_51]PIY47274.1 MAG: SIR2 family 